MNKYCKLILFIIYISVVSGCYHLQWKTNANNRIGKNINDPKTHVTTMDNFREAQQIGRLYKEVHESPNTRYYFNDMLVRCKYSLLVDSHGTILSWDFVDYKKRKECYVY